MNKIAHVHPGILNVIMENVYQSRGFVMGKKTVWMVLMKRIAPFK